MKQATADSHCPARHPVRAVAGCLWLHGHSWPVPRAEAKQKPEKANTPRSSPGSVTGGSRWGRARILVPSSGGDTAVSSVAFPRVLSGPQRWPARRSRAHRGCFLSELPGVTASGPGLVPGSPSQRFPYKAVGTGSGPREQIPGTRPYTWVIFWPHGNEDPTAGVPVVVATPDVL